ncbi:MAG: hypothetical protein JW801_14285 [Bacteroidales bacterium]|nr:hypothetical protein [Bacteroidales bacterium]
MDIAQQNKVYIADIQTILPPLYKSDEIVKRVYCRDDNTLSPIITDRIVKRINIRYRPLIINPDKLPDKVLIHEDQSSLSWGINLVNRLTHKIPVEKIGFFGLAYNVSSIGSSLPNLSSQILSRTNLRPDVIPEEKLSYGCASGILALQRAMEYCQKSEKAAIVYVFDQCSWAANIIQDKQDPDFKNSFINSLIFGDGGVGILLIPEVLRKQFSTTLLEIQGISQAFEPTDTMHFDESGIKLNDKIHKIIPQIACSRIIDPLLRDNNLKVTDIDEWSFHQGGIPILNEFQNKELLGLADHKIAPSRELYYRYGNLSSASVFFVLSEHFHHSGTSKNKGIAVSFGSGFYLGGILYEKQ